MKEKKSKLIRILIMEIEDLAEDLVHLMSVYRGRRDKGEISTYVFKENSAILASEITCLRDFARRVAAMDLEGFTTLDELCARVNADFQAQRRECGSTPALEGVFERKLQKVLLFVTT